MARAPRFYVAPSVIRAVLVWSIMFGIFAGSVMAWKEFVS